MGCWFLLLVRSFVVGAVLLGTPSAEAEQPVQVFRIGLLTHAWSAWHSNTNGFRDGLKELGYVEGQRVVFDTRAAEGTQAVCPRWPWNS